MFVRESLRDEESSQEFDTNPLTPKPEPELSEAEIREMHEAHKEKQAALDEAWAAYHRAIRHNPPHWFREDRMKLSREQEKLNDERKALPPLPMTESDSGMSRDKRLKLVRQIRNLNGI